MSASADLLNALTGSLVHFLWQGAAIAALAAALMFFFRSPTTRYLVGIGALALMLASFAITFCMLRGSPGNSVEISLQLPAHVAANTWMPDYSAPLSHTAVAAEHDFLWVARTWLAGVLALALRIVFGLLVIEQLRRRNLIALPAPLVERFTVLQQRLGIRRFIRYCECQRVRVPAVIGFFRPVVLIPVRALTGLSVEQLEAVVAHELGHIKRFDVAVNFVQVIAETLFFFHPAVWWLNRRIRADREDCCDDVAVVMSGGRLGYARALAAMATWREVPRFAMAATGSPLASRVARLLGAGESDAGSRTAGVLAALLVLVSALIAGVVSLGLVKPAQAASADHAFAPSPPAAPHPPEASAPPAASAPPEASAPVAVEAPLASPVPVAEPTPVASAKPVSPPSPPDKAIPAAPAEPQSSYIDALESAGLHNLEIDQLIALRVQSVTPEYVRDMRGTGLNPNVHELVAMNI